MSNDEVLRLWPQASAELAGFAAHLEARGSTLMAAQLRMAIGLADAAHDRIRIGRTGVYVHLACGGETEVGVESDPGAPFGTAYCGVCRAHFRLRRDDGVHAFSWR